MNKKERIKKQAWKFFWEQKVEEVAKFLTYSILGVVALYLLSFFGRWVDVYFKYLWEDEVFFENMNLWYEHFVYGFFGICIILFCCIITFMIWKLSQGIGCIIEDWIDSNWEKAEKRARKVIKR